MAKYWLREERIAIMAGGILWVSRS